MDNRKFVVVNENEFAIGDALKLASALHSSFGCAIEMYTKNIVQDVPEGIVVHGIPQDADNRPKVKNYVIKQFKSAGFIGKLHMLEDTIELLKDPKQFVQDIENMMDMYDLNNWFSTITDGCNHIYSKYNPRLDITIDKEEYKKLGISNAIFCSHSNVQWIVLNLEKADDNELYFNESFTVDMYWIIEFLARRRNTHPGSLYFMNQYYTCKSEHGLFDFVKGQKKKDEDQSEIQRKMQEEDKIFKSLNVNYAPDNNIDNVLELLYEKLNSKIQTM